ncbi:hypothetical protein DS901_12635 [Loktanella sp. D2R18]|uniref:alginate O-acetyltransferase AlgX-related protein n=1 Tax=Rhodobacterales TaxID=204455 RepID=UPI000DEBAECF|nr:MULTISPECIES: hypothetical protein [Rhodobacterales]MDO6591924.1 hypothetical protein [Yoonia sp. 1_MG-2023]RBW42644.1 hypothetical protein DS901_12635 [Loktanella sp. D2R18]
MFIDKTIKLAAPVAFFGYAVFANIALFQSDVEGPKLDGLVKGGFTQEVDTLYRANLPHRDLAVGWVGAARYLVLNEGRDGVVAGADGWLFSAEEFRPQDPDIIRLEATLDYIVHVQEQLATMGSELVLVPLPAKTEVNQTHLTNSAPAMQIAGTYDAFRDALKARGIPHVDARPALYTTRAAFFQTDTHWTAEGAQAVAQTIAASGVIDHGTDTFTRMDHAPITFTGDLVSFVTSENLAPVVGLGVETITPYIAEMATKNDTGAIDLFGNDGPAQLVLVGTSYSANPNWSFVEALKLALNQDIVNYAKEGQGPIAPMQAYLETLDPEEASRVVIWEFPVRYLSDPSLMGSVSNKNGDDNV